LNKNFEMPRLGMFNGLRWTVKPVMVERGMDRMRMVDWVKLSSAMILPHVLWGRSSALFPSHGGISQKANAQNEA
jgi:hypothetical protein